MSLTIAHGLMTLVYIIETGGNAYDCVVSSTESAFASSSSSRSDLQFHPQGLVFKLFSSPFRFLRLDRRLFLCFDPSNMLFSP